jgi:2-polyprenyl-3-methyl-5-hydroxy-6-metoxy-1,4-benzoquinol methylase
VVFRRLQAPNRPKRACSTWVTVPAMTATTYFAAHTGEEERLRLAGLQVLYDETTRRRLLAGGLRAGQRCLELGAGGGSIACMLAEHTGTRVVAVDLDPRFLDPNDARYEIRKLDVTQADALAGEQFDVIHCRCLLMHLPDVPGLLRTLHARLSPGGFLLVEEPNMLSWGAADPAAPDAALFDRVAQRSLAAVERAGVWRNALGPRLPGLLEQAGFQDVRCDGACWVPSLERPELRALFVQSLQLVAVHGVAAGEVTEDEVQRALELMRTGALRQVTPTIFGTLGRRAP